MKIWVCCDETKISQLHYYVCEVLELLFIFFFQNSHLNSSSQWENALHPYITCYRYGGGGGGVDQKVVADGYIPDVTMKIWVCWDKTRISQLHHCVCDVLELLFIFFPLQNLPLNPAANNKMRYKHTYILSVIGIGEGLGSIRKLWLSLLGGRGWSGSPIHSRTVPSL